MNRNKDDLKKAKKRLLKLLLEQEPALVNEWVFCPKPKGKARLRLLCLPYAGGDISTYYTWTDHLPDEVEVCLIQLPGRGRRFNEVPYHHVSLLIPELAKGILPVLNIPFVLFGHSMGALLSFELARYLRRHYSLQPELLVPSGHHAPHLPKLIEPLSSLSKEQFIEALRAYNGTPPAFFENKELIEFFLPVLRADFSLSETYSYLHEEPLACPIAAYGASNDPDVALADLLAWRDLTSKKVEVRVFPGDHFYIETARDLLLQVLTKDLKECLSDR